MAVYKRGETWWYKFTFAGIPYRESTKQGNKRIAEQIEAARKTQLAKGEVGIEDRKQAPTLGEFADKAFLPFVIEQKKNKPSTVRFYKDRVAQLRRFPRLWKARLAAIQPEDLTAFISWRQGSDVEISTINRDLATIRRMFKLAMEWKRVSGLMPKVRLLTGENRRERVISPDEETSYLAAAAPLLKDFAILEFDCGLRPEEAHRLKWSQVREGNVEVHKGKTKHARRSIPASPRVVEMLTRRRATVEGELVFPAPTKTGHINEDSLKKQHNAAIKAAKLERFVVYSMRHTCLTRWAESGMDAFTLKKLAGHADISTTLRYVHMSDKQARASLEKVWAAQGGHKSGHNHEIGTEAAIATSR